jgi:hypothetical protein
MQHRALPVSAMLLIVMLPFLHGFEVNMALSFQQNVF